MIIDGLCILTATTTTTTRSKQKKRDAQTDFDPNQE